MSTSLTKPYIWEKQKKLKFISRITASMMIFKRFDANVVEMIFRGRLPIGGGRWWVASSQSEGFSLKQMLPHKHSLQLQADWAVYDTDACQILKEKISTTWSPKNRIWLRSEWHRHLDRLDQWSMYPKSPPSKNDLLWILYSLGRLFRWVGCISSPTHVL